MLLAGVVGDPIRLYPEYKIGEVEGYPLNCLNSFLRGESRGNFIGDKAMHKFLILGRVLLTD